MPGFRCSEADLADSFAIDETVERAQSFILDAPNNIVPVAHIRRRGKGFAEAMVFPTSLLDVAHSHGNQRRGKSQIHPAFGGR